ncbi:aminoglycoside phosphotransferase family protein [bacterium]|nr:aminoglycoside phosphotransferase family protein [bacterium]
MTDDRERQDMELQADPDGRLDVPEAVVHCLLKQQFPHLAELPIRCVDPPGWDNRSFRLGEELLLRLPSAERYVAQVAKEIQWLPFLADRLSVSVPVVLVSGRAGCGYPWTWSIRRWIEGEAAHPGIINDRTALASQLAEFSVELWSLSTAGVPAPGQHNFHRGGSLAEYDGEVRAALEALSGSMDVSAAEQLWQAALASGAESAARWVHGDLYPGNILLHDGRLTAVIDWGGLAAGDPACDMSIAWTLLDPPARCCFRNECGADAGLWLRGAAWTLWKALITLADPAAQKDAQDRSRALIETILREAD